MEALDRFLTAKAPQLSYVSAQPRRPLDGRRARVGFVSQFLHNHTIGRVFKGLIGQLDRSRFEVVVAHLPHARRDPLRSEIDACADQVLDLPRQLAAQRAALEAAQLDLLFFTDIGMATASYELARSRLAPVQAVGWGHPDTTGLRSVDHFVSWDLAEPAGAEAHYTERLVRLPRLACYYEPPDAPPAADRAAAGLPSDGALYGCLQNLFKLHPDFDAVLAEIVALDPEGWLIFAQGPQPAWEAMLRRRWAAYPALDARAVFLPVRPLREYLGVVAAMDVMLDPPHFGSGNTFYDAMGAGVPVVTWPGEFARGRIVSAAYAQMGAGGDLIVPDLADYAARAVAIAHADQGEMRAGLAAAARAGLFADLEAVRGFERYLLDAIAAAHSSQSR
jgi:predicted O-linked N-acetylglucosamine transferase (SPINDLY family)